MAVSEMCSVAKRMDEGERRDNKTFWLGKVAYEEGSQAIASTKRKMRKYGPKLESEGRLLRVQRLERES